MILKEANLYRCPQRITRVCITPHAHSRSDAQCQRPQARTANLGLTWGSPTTSHPLPWSLSFTGPAKSLPVPPQGPWNLLSLRGHMQSLWQMRDGARSRGGNKHRVLDTGTSSGTSSWAQLDGQQSVPFRAHGEPQEFLSRGTA